MQLAYFHQAQGQTQASLPYLACPHHFSSFQQSKSFHPLPPTPPWVPPWSQSLSNPPTVACPLTQVVQQGGVYANGQVVVQPLPAAIYGESTERTVPLRRLEAVLTEEELQEHSNKEMQKVGRDSWSTAVCEQWGQCIVCGNWGLLPVQDHWTYSCIAFLKAGSCESALAKKSLFSTCIVWICSQGLVVPLKSHQQPRVSLCKRLSDTWLTHTVLPRHQAI